MINTSANRDTDNIHWLYNCEELQQMYLHDIPAYVYFIKHIPTGKFYYGSRYNHIKKNILPVNDLWINYFSSSKEIAQLRNETGNDSFEYKIIFTNSDPDTCFNYEQSLIKEHINDPLCLNKRYFDSTKGSTVFCIFGKTLSSKGKPKSETHKQNISIAQKLNGGNGPAKHKEESKNKTRETMKLLPRANKVCPHCNKEGGFLSMSRWHFDNCKEKK